VQISEDERLPSGNYYSHCRLAEQEQLKLQVIQTMCQAGASSALSFHSQSCAPPLRRVESRYLPLKHIKCLYIEKIDDGRAATASSETES
jgi:hypothetical protein